MRIDLCAGLASALVIAACGAETDAPQAANAGSTPAVQEMAPGGENQTEESSGLETREIGPLSFRYDPDRLAAVELFFELPPDWDQEVSGLKLISADRLSLMGREECMYGQAGMELECTPSSEAGIAFTILEENFSNARDRMAGESRQPVTLAEREGISWSIGVEGERSEFTLLPAGDQTVLIQQRTRNRENPDSAVIEQVKNSLRIES